MQSGYAVGGWGYVIWNTPFSEDGAGCGCSCRNTWFHPTSDDPTTDNTVVSQKPDSRQFTIGVVGFGVFTNNADGCSPPSSPSHEHNLQRALD
jgi:hypothetical protein